MIFDDKNILAFYSVKDDGNIAFHVGDDKQNVEQNRKRLASKYNYDNKKLVYMEQTHSCNIKIVDNSSAKLQENCDALITNCVNLPLMVMVADCMPILIYDKKKRVIAVVHSGRNGTFLNIAPKTVKKMVEEFGSNSNDILVYIGASICKDCYEVDENLANIAINSFGISYVQNNHIDLKSICIDQLISCGIHRENIKDENYCTKCSGDKYFSYRRDFDKSGRFALVIQMS